MHPHTRYNTDRTVADKLHMLLTLIDECVFWGVRNLVCEK